MRSLKHTYVSEEFFLQSILGNSIYKDKINPDNLRYADWHGRHGSCPAIIDETDFDKIIATNKYFARKIGDGISDKLVTRIYEYVDKVI